MQRYLASNRLRDLLADNPMLLPALSRFGITLGFGDSSVRQVCEGRGVDTATFLAVANFISGNPFDNQHIDIPTIVGYLKNAHNYFIDYQLPNIRRNLIEAISTGGGNSDIALVILKFYDEYTSEVRAHMEYENTHVFTYVDNLLAGRAPSHFSIAQFRDNHKPIAAKLHEIKEILICHYTADNNRVDMLNSLLFSIVNCERDLVAHCRVEDNLFIPAVERLENHVMAEIEAKAESNPDNPALDANGDIVLTPRERDIVASIARGKSNKEIADELCLSVHTVATHRRNICAKLNIHSASGMTIFAILHGLISMDEGEKLIHS